MELRRATLWFLSVSVASFGIACGLDDDESAETMSANVRAAETFHKRCIGATPQGASNWQQYYPTSLYLDIDISSCAFTTDPLYFTSLGGAMDHSNILGANSIYRPTTSGFRIYLQDLNGAVDPNLANQRLWHINWEAVLPSSIISYGLGGAGGSAEWYLTEYECVGKTPAGQTAWQQYGSNGVYVDVDTSACGFASTPRYLTSLGGRTMHWQARGATSIYSPTTTGFRVYLNYPGITPNSANGWDWHVLWKGLKETSCVGATGSSAWVQSASGPNAIYLDVDTSSCGRVRYQTSLGGRTRHWTTIGATSILDPTPTGFRIVLVGSDLTPQRAVDANWHINWVAFH